MNHQITYLREKFPCREAEINKLCQLYARKDEPFVDALYVYGVTGTGKTSLVQTVLKTFEIKHATVDLIRCNTTRVLFECLLEQLLNDTSETISVPIKCDNLMDFILQLKNNIADQIVLVLDKSERLRDMDVNLFPAFLQLRELTGLDISVIFISTLAFTKVIQKLHACQPVTMHFRQYSREEVLKILMLICNRHIAKDSIMTDDFYKNYLSVLLSVFYQNCRDLRELRHQAEINLNKYCEPVIKGEITAGDVSKLWRNIAPTLKMSLEKVYMRTNAPNTDTATPVPLPFYAKYLLIASYLASYNPAKEDRRLFAKDHGKKRKTMAHVKRKEKVSELLATQLGPKQFTLDRLLAIFFSIVDERVGLCSNLMVQISSLVQMQMLTSVGDGVNLDAHKFKCNVDYECVQHVSKMVGFNIRKYLYDFV